MGRSGGRTSSALPPAISKVMQPAAQRISSEGERVLTSRCTLSNAPCARARPPSSFQSAQQKQQKNTMPGESVISSTLATHLKRVRACKGGGKDQPLAPRRGGRASVVQAAVSKSKHLENQAQLEKEKGSACYKGGEYPKAHLHFTRCIGLARKPITKAHGFANRSAVLFQAAYFEDSIKDVDRALEHSYPRELQYNLLLRKAQCLRFLGKEVEAKEAFEKVVLDIESLNCVGAEQLISAVTKKFENETPLEKCALLVKAMMPSQWHLPESDEEKLEIPCFSNAVEFGYEKVFGRMLKAKRDIAIGEVLIVEKPVCSVVSLEAAHVVCANCFKVCYSTIPCRYCEHAFYCSKECMDYDHEHGHKVSCRMVTEIIGGRDEKVKPRDDFVMPGTISQKEAILALSARLLGKLGKEQIVKHLQHEAPDPKNPAKYLTAESDLLDSLLVQMDQILDLSNREQRDYSTFALHLAGQLGTAGEERLQVAAFVLKLILVVAQNHKLVMHANVYEHHYFHGAIGLAQSALGIALYRGSSYVNHSCAPNTIAIHYGANVVYRVIRPIQAGEQITETYVTNLGSPYERRQETNMNMFKFACKCMPCRKGLQLSDFPKLDKEVVLPLLKEVHMTLNSFHRLVCFCEPRLYFALHQAIRLLNRMSGAKLEHSYEFLNLATSIGHSFMMEGNVSISELGRMVLHSSMQGDNVTFLGEVEDMAMLMSEKSAEEPAGDDTKQETETAPLEVLMVDQGADSINEAASA